MEVELVEIDGLYVIQNEEGLYVQHRLIPASVGQPLSCSWGSLETAASGKKKAGLIDLAKRLRFTIVDRTLE